MNLYRWRAISLVVLVAAIIGWGGMAGAANLPRLIPGADGAPLVLVPKGVFIMGSPFGGFIFGDNETPQKKVKLPSFYIDKFEVTNARFRKFFVPKEAYARSFEQDDQPVVGVTWYQARDYCQRVGKRLPTEAEWEKAARGTNGRIFPWGDKKANCDLAVMGITLPSCTAS